jgi:hypothetical protein
MNKVIIDPSLLPQLGDLHSRVELCDNAGRTLGYFVPVSEQKRLLYAWARGEFTDREIDLARREPGGAALAEILAELGAK